MNALRWKEISDLAGVASDTAPEQREALLASRPDLRDEVESLLYYLEDGSGPLDREPPLPAGVSLVGRDIGPYHVIRELGQGGMGVVLLASRAYAGFEQLVAMKLARTAFQSDFFARRFLEERQILARLEHSNIARLLDGGVTDDGSPYLVMQYVEGEPLDRWCATNALTVGERIGMFLKVCAAVEYAHEHLVVHRDLKPANILVTAGGEPMLLDFGTARLVETGESSGFTKTALPVMTLRYASPEQLAGLAGSTRSDVYSLCVVLYELLTGRWPYPDQGDPAPVLIRLISEEEAVPPSRSGGARAAALAGDLDAILLKGLEKNPERRYGSVAQLADDLRRFLSREPVVARQPTWTYRAGRFLSRHRISAGATAMAAIVLIGAGAAVVSQARVAQQRFEYVRKLAGSMIFEMHDGIARLPGSTAVRKQLVAKGLEYLDVLAKEAGGDVALLNELAVGYLRLGDVLGRLSSNNLGDVEGAVKAWQKAEGLAIRVLARDSRNLTALQTLAAINQYMAEVDNNQGRGGEAMRRRQEAVALSERIVAIRPPSDVRALRSLASAYFGMSGILGRKHNDESLAYMRKALEAFEKVLAREPQSADALRNVALCQKRLGSQLIATGNEQEGLSLLQRARDNDEKRVSANPHDAQARMDLAITASEIGVHLKRERRFTEALPFFERSHELRKSLYEADAQDERSRARFVYSLIHLADTRRELGNADAALVHYRQAITIESASPVEPSHAIWAYAGAGRAELDRRRIPQACTALTEAIARSDKWGKAKPLGESMQKIVETARSQWSEFCRPK